MRSLRNRLLLTLGGLLLLSVAAALVAADLRFRELGREARRDVLQALNLAVLGVVDEDAAGLLRPVSALAEPRLSTPRSGLYIEIHPRNQPPSWQSGSLAGTSIRLPMDVPPGGKRLVEVPLSDGRSLLALAQGVAWEGSRGRREYVLVSAEDQSPYQAQLRRLRGQFLLGGALFLGSAALVIALAASFLLRPVRRMERQISEVEIGQREALQGDWPRELDGVAKNLNALLKAERERAERYRHTLGNLAHSLKTPLSVLRTLLSPGIGSSSAPEPDDVTAARWRAEVGAQVDRMQDIVQHQLRRATAGSLAPGVAWTPVIPVVEDVVGALRKVYADRTLSITVQVPDTLDGSGELASPLDRGDLLELVGNLLDNACKFAEGRVAVSLAPWMQPGWRRAGVELQVDDDGPGVDPTQRERILQRGVRLDEQVPGQGIGLSVVSDLVSLPGGSVAIDRSPWGGSRFSVRLPGR